MVVHNYSLVSIVWLGFNDAHDCFDPFSPSRFRSSRRDGLCGGNDLPLGYGIKDKNMALTKAEIVQIVVDNVGLNKREALEMVEAFFEEISTSLEAGEDVKLSGFGGFQLHEKPERPGRNPITTARYAVITPRMPRREQPHRCFLDKTRWVVERILDWLD